MYMMVVFYIIPFYIFPDISKCLTVEKWWGDARGHQLSIKIKEIFFSPLYDVKFTHYQLKWRWVAVVIYSIDETF